MPSRQTHPVLVLLSLVWMVLSIGCATTPGEERDVERVTDASEMPWTGFRSMFLQEGGRPAVADEIREEVSRLDRVLRQRAVVRSDGIEFGQLMLAAGALYPDHSHATPEAYLVLSGEAEWTVDGETRRVAPGTSIHHAPYSDHRWVTTSQQPLRAVFARWLPDGERTGLVSDGLRRRGGSSTGDFFAGERRSKSVLPTQQIVPTARPRPGGPLDEMRQARLAARMKEPQRPVVRSFFDSVGIPWNTDTPGIRWRLALALTDFEWGQLEIEGASGNGRVRTLAPSSVPGLLHVLSGRARLRVAGGRWTEVSAGTSFSFWPAEPVEIAFDEQAETLRALWLRWAPGGDRSYRSRDFFLTEPVPDPARGVGLAVDVDFFAPETTR